MSLIRARHVLFTIRGIEWCGASTTGYHALPRLVSVRHVTNGPTRPFVLPLQISCVMKRYAKRKASITLDDLPQGMVALDPLPYELNEPAYPTVVQQARTNMRKFENCVLLTRVGGFYELYFEQADEYGPLLNLKVAQKKTNAGSVSMAGFPFFQLDRILKILVQDLNKYVAIAEEFPNNASAKVKSGGLLHDRKVARIITPGTLIDENFMDPYVSNFILAVHVEGSRYDRSIESSEEFEQTTLSSMATMPLGLAWLDLSTGTFLTQSTTLGSLASVISRLSPREIILDEGLKADTQHGIHDVLDAGRNVITYTPPCSTMPISKWSTMLESPVTQEDCKKFTEGEILAGSSLLDYVKERLQGLSMKLQPPMRYSAQDVMEIDKNSMRALEIKETIRDRVSKGSLLHAVRRTVTKSGTRLLHDWITSPCTSIDVINSRLDVLSNFVADSTFREHIVILLKRSFDSQRLVQKFSLGRGDPDDLLALAKTINTTLEILTILEDFTKSQATDAKCMGALIQRIHIRGPKQLAKKITDAVDEAGVEEQHRIEDGETGQAIALAQAIASTQGSEEDVAAITVNSRKRKATSLREHYGDGDIGWTMKPSASLTLEQLHEELVGLQNEKKTLSDELRVNFNATSLTLRWTPGLGHICHVKGRDMKNLASMPTLSSSKSTRSFHHPDWTSLGQKTDAVKIAIRAEEQRVFIQLRDQVIKNLVKLRRNAQVLDELDIACSSATLAVEQSLNRPILNNSTSHIIVAGRHPTVEVGLQEQGRSFTTNDCFINDQERLWLITGPNMAGKSTFLRQNALITIMAQAGMYVPAEYAEIGIVDKIFSRVGSADDLYRDQSTFMVEMLESATILRDATQRSFVIMDEIGRGTTPSDGTAVAYGCLHHLYHVNQCRTLFATHFHDLADMAKDMNKIGYYCTDVREDPDGGFGYMHRLKQGVNRDSHAFKVASLAGLPSAAIEVAKRVLKKNLEKAQRAKPVKDV